MRGQINAVVVWLHVCVTALLNHRYHQEYQERMMVRSTPFLPSCAPEENIIRNPLILLKVYTVNSNSSNNVKTTINIPSVVVPSSTC